MTALAICVLRGLEVVRHLDDVARLRIEVFKDWPYLYAGGLAYEREYLQTYSGAARSLFVLAMDGRTVVGAATGVPLEDEVDAIKEPLARQGVDADGVFYFGESVLLPAYRGQGIGHRFFDEREHYARSMGRSVTMFCSVVRSPDDARRPAHHRSNDAFWTGRGYREMPGIRCSLDWQEIGASAPSSQQLTYWIRDLGDRG